MPAANVEFNAHHDVLPLLRPPSPDSSSSTSDALSFELGRVEEQPVASRARGAEVAKVISEPGSRADDLAHIATSHSQRPDLKRRRKVEWSKSEDAAITASVRRYGTQWEKISDQFSGRTPDAVRNRWHRIQRTNATRDPQQVNSAADTMLYCSCSTTPDESSEPLSPNAKRECIRGFDHGRAMWTASEDAIIAEGVRQFGCKWRQIAATLEGRSDSSVRNRWMRILKDSTSNHAAISANLFRTPADVPGLHSHLVLQSAAGQPTGLPIAQATWGAQPQWDSMHSRYMDEPQPHSPLQPPQQPWGGGLQPSTDHELNPNWMEEQHLAQAQQLAQAQRFAQPQPMPQQRQQHAHMGRLQQTAYDTQYARPQYTQPQYSGQAMDPMSQLQEQQLAHSTYEISATTMPGREMQDLGDARSAAFSTAQLDSLGLPPYLRTANSSGARHDPSAWLAGNSIDAAVM